MSDIKLIKPYLYITNITFDPDRVLTIDIELPSSVKSLNIPIVVDSIFNIPYIEKLYTNSYLFAHIPTHDWYILCIFSISLELPIMAGSDSDELCWNQKVGISNTVSIQLDQNKITLFLYNIVAPCQLVHPFFKQKIFPNGKTMPISGSFN